MDDTDPQKFFMSGEGAGEQRPGETPNVVTQPPAPSPAGFTGYVPRARFLFGAGFPVLTNQALQEFGQTCTRGRARKDPKPLSPPPRPSFQNLSLLPHYGGYVPGERLWGLRCVCRWDGLG